MIIDGNYTKVSQVSGIETELDLHKVKLYGFQRKVVRQSVEDIQRRIRNKENLPRVCVIAQNPTEYYMACLFEDGTGRIDGGHHRAYAHFIQFEPLPVKIVNARYIAHPPWILVSDIKLELCPERL